MEPEVRARAREEISRILESASFDVVSMDPPLDLSAIRGDECVLVLCSDAPAEAAEFDRTVYRVRTRDRDVVCRKILFSTADPFPVGDCVRWGLPALVDYAGKAACARVLGRELVLDLAPADTPEVLRAPARSSAGGVAMLPVRISEREARQLAGTDGTARLRLIPFWLAVYASSGRTTYRDKAISFDEHAAIAINAINGELETEPDLDDLVQDELPEGADVLEGLIPRDRAEASAVEYVVGRLTQKVRIRQERRDAIFYEEKVFRPDRRAIRVDLSRFFVPVWQVRGRSIVEINAYSGETLSSPMDEGVEIL